MPLRKPCCRVDARLGQTAPAVAFGGAEAARCVGHGLRDELRYRLRRVANAEADDSCVWVLRQMLPPPLRDLCNRQTKRWR